MLKAWPMKAGDGYAAHHLSANDYYEKGKTVSGVWQGQGARKLGLYGQEVENQAFDLMTESKHPVTGEFLRCRKSADRIKDGEVIREARNVYDNVVGSPKSVSIMAIVGGDERLRDAHKKAVSEMLAEYEKHATTRDQRFGQKIERETGNLLIARYEHDSSRQLDPHLHSHCVMANMTYDAQLDRWTALHMGPLFQRTEYFNQVYLNALCREVEALGYETEKCKDGKGNGDTFRIKGISQELEEFYSQRSKERDQAIAKFVRDEGREPTPDEITELVRRTRDSSLREITTAEVRAEQLHRLENEFQNGHRDGVDMIASVRARAAEREIAGFDKPVHDPVTSVEYAIDHAFSRKSVEYDFRLKTEALKHGRGNITLEGIHSSLHDLESTGKILRYKNEITTQEALDRESGCIAMVDEGRGIFERLDKGKASVVTGVRSGVTNDQAMAIDGIRGSRDFVINLCGAPGTGKTTVLGMLREEMDSRGIKYVGLVPSKSAEGELQKVGFENTMQLSALLQDKDAGAKIQGCVIFLDEASQVGAESMHKLLAMAKGNNARIILSGDSKQTSSVEAGDILRTLEKNSKMRSFEMLESVRFTNPKVKEVVELMRDKPGQAFDKMDGYGMIHEPGYFERPAAVAQKAKELGGALIVGRTHGENARSNHAVKQSASLEESRLFERMENLNYTEAQKKDLSNFEVGMHLIFHRKVDEAKPGQDFEVVSHRDRFLLCRDSDGNEAIFSKKQMGACGVFKKSLVEVSVGDKIVFNANSKGEFKCTNGEQDVVTGFDKKGNIQFEDRTMTDEFRQWNLGYAVTAQKAQGKTTENVIGSGYFQQRGGYVAFSRGRESVNWFVDDKEMARELFQISEDRMSAIELVQMMQHRGQWAGGDVNAQRSAEQVLSANALRQQDVLAQHGYANYMRGRGSVQNPGQEIAH